MRGEMKHEIDLDSSETTARVKVKTMKKKEREGG